MSASSLRTWLLARYRLISAARPLAWVAKSRDGGGSTVESRDSCMGFGLNPVNLGLISVKSLYVMSRLSAALGSDRAFTRGACCELVMRIWA